MPEDKYDEEYVLSEQTKLNLKCGQLFVDQSKDSIRKGKRKNGTSERQSENRNDQSQSNRYFENKNKMNKIEQSVKGSSGQSKINASNSSRLSQLNSKDIGKEKVSKLNSKITEMGRETFYHWVATREIMEIKRKRIKSMETRTLVEQRNALSRPGTLRRRYDPRSQRTILVPSRSNKLSREEIAEIDAELLQRANRLGAATNRSKTK